MQNGLLRYLSLAPVTLFALLIAQAVLLIVFNLNAQITISYGV